jgi:hypothetical protein
MTELERLEKLKQEAIDNPPKKVKGCKSCKKKKEVEVQANTELPAAITEYFPTINEVKEAFIMLGNPKPEEKIFIEKVFYGLYKQNFDWNCPSCVHRHTQIIKNYLKDAGIKL